MTTGSSSTRDRAMIRLGFPETEVTGSQITAALQELGIQQGDALIFHSALSSLGYLEGGANTLIDSVLSAVGPAGTAMVPCLPDSTQPFDPRRSPAVVGQVSEAFRLRPEAVRSLHPTHSVAAIGAEAQYLAADHDQSEPCGVGSPYVKLAKLEGWVLLIGVDQDRNTTLHAAETLADVPYLLTLEREVIGSKGASHTVTVARCAGGHREFIGLDREMREKGIVRVGRVGSAALRLMPSKELVDFSVARLRRDPAAFLCKKPRCTFCRWAEARISEHFSGKEDTADWQSRSRQWGCPDTHCEVCYV